MVKVKVIKLPDGVPEDDRYIKLGQVYEAFELRDEESESCFYKHYFALNIGFGIYHILPENVEIIDESVFITPTQEDLENCLKGLENQEFVKVPSSKQKILLVEDGSVDETELNAKDIPYLVYRQGATPPFILEI